MKTVKHYINYRTGEFKIMPESEHRRLHARLREEGKCKIPVEELSKLSAARHHKDDIQQMWFQETLLPNVRLCERVCYNKNTGTVGYSAGFRAYNKKRLYFLNDNCIINSRIILTKEIRRNNRIVCPHCHQNNTQAVGYTRNKTAPHFHRVWCHLCNKTFYTDYTKEQWLDSTKVVKCVPLETTA